MAKSTDLKDKVKVKDKEDKKPVVVVPLVQRAEPMGNGLGVDTDIHYWKHPVLKIEK